MSDRSNEHVPRGDHVPGGPNDASTAEMNQKAEPGTDSPTAKDADRGGDSGRDGGRAGGSVIDKR